MHDAGCACTVKARVRCSRPMDRDDIRLATRDDISAIVALNCRYLLPNLSEAQRSGGFLGKLYTHDELSQIIARREIAVAAERTAIVGYYLIGNKHDPDSSAYGRNPALTLHDGSGAPLSTIAYPTQVCIDEACRNRGLFPRMLT